MTSVPHWGVNNLSGTYTHGSPVRPLLPHGATDKWRVSLPAGQAGLRLQPRDALNGGTTRRTLDV